MALASCKKESGNDTTLPTSQKDVVTFFSVSFYNVIDSSVNYCSYVDTDGDGPLFPSISGTALKVNAEYEVSIRLKDESRTPAVDLYSKLRSDGKNYKVCFSNTIGLTLVPTDSDGSLPIGFESTLKTGATPDFSNFNFTIMHQPGVKNGSCSPGTVYFNCSIPVSIVN
jgi:hypothetical protein